MEKKGRLRLMLAVLLAAGGVAAVSPSLAFDSDHDGVGDSVEVYQLGTDPSSADMFPGSQAVAEGRKGR